MCQAYFNFIKTNITIKHHWMQEVHKNCFGSKEHSTTFCQEKNAWWGMHKCRKITTRCCYFRFTFLVVTCFRLRKTWSETVIAIILHLMNKFSKCSSMIFLTPVSGISFSIIISYFSCIKILFFSINSSRHFVFFQFITQLSIIDDLLVNLYSLPFKLIKEVH